MNKIEEKYTNLYRSLTLVAGLIFVLFCIFMFWEEYVAPPWKSIQKNFSQFSGQDASIKDIMSDETGIRQTEMEEINHIDRCISCHLNMGTESGQKLPLPYASHPGNILASHNLSDYSCTFCHSGIGRSLRREDTCPEKPSPNGRPVESHCAGCHLVLYDPSLSDHQMPKLSAGINLFHDSGCLGCHRVRGTGGPFGPDLTYQGDKILQGYSFKYVKNDNSIYNWHREHLTDPGKISPSSIMPQFNLADTSVNNLITLILGFTKPILPIKYYDLNVIKEFKHNRRALDMNHVYQDFCNGCHGRSGNGRQYKGNDFGVPTLSNPDFQAVASLDFLSFMTVEGRSNRYMPSWRGKHSGLYKRELVSLVRILREWRRPPPAFEAVKRAQHSISTANTLYSFYCATCHGKEQQGDIGPSLNNTSFSTFGSDRFLYRTIVQGRSNTAMPAWSHFDAKSIKSLIRLLKPAEDNNRPVRHKNLKRGNIKKGKLLFHYKCSRCHGTAGNGGIGPAILNRDFIASVDDIFLKETINQGRNHTPMFRSDQSPTDIEDILSFIYSHQDSIPDHIDPGPSLGNPDLGKNIFMKNCSKCHGNGGEGVEAPALNNQEFLNAATNGYILATVTLGRAGTPMPSWGLERENNTILTSRERHHVVSYIRKWQTLSIKRGKDDPVYQILRDTRR